MIIRNYYYIFENQKFWDTSFVGALEKMCKNHPTLFHLTKSPETFIVVVEVELKLEMM